MDLTANTASHRDAFGAASAGVGAAAWVAAPWLPAGTPPAAGSLDHLFLFMPLVAAPLALDLLTTAWGDDGGAPSPLLGFARVLQPAAAALVLSSFCAPKGLAAGMLTTPWLVMALIAAAGGVTDAWRRRGFRDFEVSLVAAQVFLPIGAAWLVLWRLGIAPRHFSPLTVSLAALHFHFNGFTSQVLIGATGRRLSRASSRLLALHRFVTVAAIAGLPLLAAGKAIPAPALRITGVGAIALGFIGLCVTSAAVAVAAQSALTRHLLLASAASAAAAVGLACAYGVGELAGRDWIGIGRMVATHGLLMSLGFTLCGLIGHLRLRRA
ncbi:MAG TPA: YndJ family transporter [Anaeromyxobacter sp.]